LQNIPKDFLQKLIEWLFNLFITHAG